MIRNKLSEKAIVAGVSVRDSHCLTINKLADAPTHSTWLISTQLRNIMLVKVFRRFVQVETFGWYPSKLTFDFLDEIKVFIGENELAELNCNFGEIPRIQLFRLNSQALSPLYNLKKGKEK